MSERLSGFDRSHLGQHFGRQRLGHLKHFDLGANLTGPLRHRLGQPIDVPIHAVKDDLDFGGHLGIP